MRDFSQRFPGMKHDPNARPLPVPWLVDDLWLRGKITAILGPEKVGKSRFIGWILTQMLANPLGGVVLQSDQGTIAARHNGFRRVLYLNAEEQSVDVQARINMYAKYHDFTPTSDWPITYVSAASMQLQNQRERDDLEKMYLANGEYDIMIIDPLRRVHAGDENNNSAMAPLHNDLRRWSNAYNLALLLVHHTPKLNDDADLGRMATWSRGATDLVTLVDGANMLRTLSETSKQSIRELRRMGRFPVLSAAMLHDYGDPSGFRLCLSG